MSETESELICMIVLLLLDHNRNYSHPPGPHVTQEPGTVHQPRTDIGQSWSSGPYTHPGQTTVSPRSTGPSIHRRASPPGGRTPARVRQRSVQGQLVPPSTVGPAHQGSQSVPEQTVMGAVTSLVTLNQLTLFQTLPTGAEPQPGPGPQLLRR